MTAQVTWLPTVVLSLGSVRVLFVDMAIVRQHAREQQKELLSWLDFFESEKMATDEITPNK